MKKYPEFDLTEKVIKTGKDDYIFTVRFQTYLRKKHTDGKWYLQPFDLSRHTAVEMRGKSLDRNSMDEFRLEFIKTCVHEVYLSQVFGAVIPDLMTQDMVGYKYVAFVLDADQTEEYERHGVCMNKNQQKVSFNQSRKLLKKLGKMVGNGKLFQKKDHG